jgi:hypothetical protein
VKNLKGNKTIIFLPLFVMAGLFVFGYFSLSDSSTLSNAELQQNIDISVSNDTPTEIAWEWGSYPADGLAGNDYIELVFDGEVENSKLELKQGDTVLFESEDWFYTDDGIAASFPTYTEEEQIIGAIGSWEVESDTTFEAVRYYHTWAGTEIEKDEPVNLIEQLQNRIPEHHWVLEEADL